MKSATAVQNSGSFQIYSQIRAPIPAPYRRARVAQLEGLSDACRCSYARLVHQMSGYRCTFGPVVCLLVPLCLVPLVGSAVRSRAVVDCGIGSWPGRSPLPCPMPPCQSLPQSPFQSLAAWRPLLSLTFRGRGCVSGSKTTCSRTG